MRFRVGINYWPASSGMRWWRHFDPVEVQRDFARIHNAGFDSVRIFLLWEDFQPSQDVVSTRALNDLLTLADIALVHELGFLPTLFTGHMSGVNWFPAWAVEPGTAPSRFRIVPLDSAPQARPKNWFTDPQMLEAQTLLAHDVATILHDHPAVWAYDLGNENSNCVVPPDRESGLAWLRQLTNELRSADPTAPVTIGIHGEDLEEDRMIGPREAGEVCDFLCMHGYPMYTSWAEGPADPMVLPFLGVVTRWMGGRDVLFEEFGAPALELDSRGAPPTVIPLLNETDAARFTAAALKQLQRFGMIGAMLWCYADYDEKLWTEPPFDLAVHERYFGLWRANGTPKPAVGVIETMTPAERAIPAKTPDWIDLSVDEFYVRPKETLSRWYQAFRKTALTTE